MPKQIVFSRDNAHPQLGVPQCTQNIERENAACSLVPRRLSHSSNCLNFCLLIHLERADTSSNEGQTSLS